MAATDRDENSPPLEFESEDTNTFFEFDKPTQDFGESQDAFWSTQQEEMQPSQPDNQNMPPPTTEIRNKGTKRKDNSDDISGPAGKQKAKRGTVPKLTDEQERDMGEWLLQNLQKVLPLVKLLPS